MLSAMFAHGTLQQRDKNRAATELPSPASYQPRSTTTTTTTAEKKLGTSAPAAPAAGAKDGFQAPSPRSKSAPAASRGLSIPTPRLARQLSGPRISPTAQRCLSAVNDFARRTIPTLPRVSSFDDFENNIF